MNYQELILNLSWSSNERYAGEVEIDDKGYNRYLYANNGGYYFGHSLHIYGQESSYEWHDFDNVNKIVSNFYASLLPKDAKVFGEDVFGNFYMFYHSGVCLFNLETTEIEHLGKNFQEAIISILSDIDYYTGISLIENMDNVKANDLHMGFRLCPKKPFVIGGEYNLSNVYLKYYKENIEYNSSIAKQIINIQDGQKVKLVIE